MKLYAEFQRYNFFRRPDWRWQRVLQICDRGLAPGANPGRCTARDDHLVRQAREFLLGWRNRETEADREHLFWKFPGLYYAYELYEKKTEEPEGGLFLEARLLARQSNAEIAYCLSTLPDTVEWYSRLFFDVVDRLDHRDWVTKHVLLPAFKRHHGALQDEDGTPLPYKDSTVAQPFLDGSLKMFAYFGGKYIVDYMVTGFQQGKPMASPDDLSQWLDNHWATSVRRRSAQAAGQFEVNKYNVMELFAAHSRIMELEQSRESASQQQSAYERNVQTMLNEIPWATGADGAKVSDGTVVGRFDVMAAELRDDELILVSAGKPVAGLDENWPARLPPPRPKQAALDDKTKEIL
jgi:hypothetical protein